MAPPQAMCNRAAACIIFGIALVLAMILMGIQGGIYLYFGGPIPTRQAYWGGLILFMTNVVSIIVTIAGCIYVAMGKHKLVVFVVLAVAMVVIVILAAVVAITVTTLKIDKKDVQSYIGRNYKNDKKEPNFLSKMQSQMACCGGVSYQDYKAKEDDEGTFTVPRTCCWSEVESTASCNTGLKEKVDTSAGGGTATTVAGATPASRSKGKGRKNKPKTNKPKPKAGKDKDKKKGEPGTMLRAFDIWMAGYEKMKTLEPKDTSAIPPDDKMLKEHVKSGHNDFMKFVFGPGQSSSTFAKDLMKDEKDKGLGDPVNIKIKVFGCGYYLQDFPDFKFISSKFGGGFQGMWLGTKILTVVVLIAEIAKTGIFIFYGIRFMREQGGMGLGGDTGASKKADGGASGRPGKKPGKEPNIANPWGF